MSGYNYEIIKVSVIQWYEKVLSGLKNQDGIILSKNSYPHIKYTLVRLLRFNIPFFTVFQIPINYILEIFFQLLHRITFIV